MKRNALTISLIALLLIASFLQYVAHYNNFLTYFPTVLTSRGGRSQGNFSSIQEAINQASNGSTVYVPSGTYFEQIVINKTISLIGENLTDTIIDGSNRGTIVAITADNVTISGFTIQNSGWGWYKNGIYVHRVGNCKISNNFLSTNCQNIRLNYSWSSIVRENRIDGTGYGIRLINSINCTAIGNYVSNCIGGVHLENATFCTVERNRFAQNDQGIRMYSPCTRNRIFENVVYNNTYDGMIEAMPGNTTFFDNKIFHNIFVNNKSPFIYKAYGNIWDDGYPSGGNYWSHYNGLDLFSGPYQNETGSDGIGDTPYQLNSYEADRYPLMYFSGSVYNINTNLTYPTIQSAIDASETMKGHTISVSSGVYFENVNINKSLSIMGENRLTTIIDGNNKGKVLSISADNVTFSGFTVRNSGSNYPPYGDDCGIYLDHVSGCNVSNCLATENRIGIYVYFSDANVIQYNRVESNLKNGIWLWFSSDNLLEGNEILNNSFNFGVSAPNGGFSHFNNQIDRSNTVNGKPIDYRIDVENEVIDNMTEVGVLYLINCFNITVQNLELMNNRHGLFGYNITKSTIQHLKTSDNSYGIYLQNSHGNIIQENEGLKNWVGIQLYNSVNNTVWDNVAGDSEKGISLYEADNNHIVENDILNCLYGIRFYSSNLNEIFHNNLINNTHQADLIISHQNTWDNGFEGNFWSDYSGPDANRDGIGDTYYIIINGTTTDQDHYPLLGRLHNFSIYDQESHSWVSVTTNSTVLNFEFEATNNKIMLRVIGTDGTYGFCRVSIPHVIVEPEIMVVIDNGLTETLHPDYFVHDDDTRRWIYFAYQQSTHEILIIPEFGVASLLLIITFLTILISVSKRTVKN